MRSDRKGFTIVELLMVIGIIAVLLGMTVSAVSGSIREARAQKANALCALVAQGIATYHAQNGEWPKEPGEPNQPSDVNEEYYRYSDSDADLVVRKVIEQTKENNPMIDVSGLFVSTRGSKTGMDFFTAIYGTKRNPTGHKLSSLSFGYPDPDTGRFKQFTIKYYPATDSISVTKYSAN